jgi:hypothetical protein
MKKWANELSRVSKEEVQITKKHIKKSSFLAIKEMQIKTALRFYLTLVRMASIKNINNKCWQNVGEKKNPHTLLMRIV